jgi:hypothetical protein
MIRKGIITSLFRGNPPMLTVSYVWSVGVPVDEEYLVPGAGKSFVIPLESDTNLVRRWLHENRNIRDDLKKLAPEEKNLVLKRIRIRCDSEDSRSKAESGIRDIVLVGTGENEKK